MSEPFIGEIRMFSGNFAPKDWMFCNGQELSISQYSPLYSLIGTTYGGTATTFNLPDMRGRLPVGQGNGPNLTPRIIAQKYGTEQEVLNINQIPLHSHTMEGSNNNTSSITPQNMVLAKDTDATYAPFNQNQLIELHPDSVSQMGGGQAHSNIMPYLCINFIIALNGIFPSRN